MKESVKRRLDEINQRDGGLSYQAVIADMKRKDSPLHGLVEWNREKAHEIYLADRAREVIRAYWIVLNECTEDDASKVIKIRKYHSLPVGNDEQTGRQIRRYFPIERIQSDESLMSSALRQALQDLNSFKLRYCHLSELAGVMTAIDTALGTCKANQSKRRGSRSSRAAA